MKRPEKLCVGSVLDSPNTDVIVCGLACATCGLLIDVVEPNYFRLVTHPRSRFSLVSNDEEQCSRCIISAANDPEHAAAMDRGFSMLRDLHEKLALPEGATLHSFRASFTSTDSSTPDEYAEIFALRVQNWPHGGMPFISFSPDNQPYRAIQLAIPMIRVRHDGIPVFVDCRWSTHDIGSPMAVVEIQNYQSLRGRRQVDPLLARLDALLGEINCGRPIGSGQPMTADSVSREYWRWVQEHGKPPRQKDEDFAALFFLRPRQLQNRLAKLRVTDGLTWPPPQPQ